MSKLKRLIDIIWHGRHRLESITLLPLDASRAEAIALYGEPVESKPSDDAPEITSLTFAVGDYHEVVAREWQGAIRSITYWSGLASPAEDLDYMLRGYRGDSQWKLLEKGYWYIREDGRLKLWCSAMPAIGVASVDFLMKSAELKTQHQLAQLEGMEDPRWAPNDAIRELQRRFQEDGDRALIDFAARSGSIAASPDGGTVFILRDQHAHDVNDGFAVLNSPPKPDDGYSTAVINFFYFNEGCSLWSSTTLPRDAQVDRFGFRGDSFELVIRQANGSRRVEFDGSAERIRSLAAISVVHVQHDEALWQELEDHFHGRDA